jgi:lysophospholipase L1-like esterase
MALLRRSLPLSVILFVALAAAGEAAKSDVPPLKNGDRIVFLGDSITQGGGGAKGYITLVKKALDENCKDFGIETVNAGISGHKVPDLQRRLQKDVLDKKPTIVFIYIGINDVWHWAMKGLKGTTKEAYEAGLKDLIARIAGAGARVILCTPSVIGEKKDGANAQDKMLEEYSEVSRKVASETKTQLCDLHKAFGEYLQAHNPDNKENGILTGDRVHLNDAGNRLVADQMLQALGVAAK